MLKWLAGWMADLLVQAEGNQSRLQEEVARMMFQLEEERKVTANLSRTLELEKRKVESLEQKAKCGSSKWSAGSRGERRRSSLLPEEVKESEARLAQSMESYRQRCDNLGVPASSYYPHPHFFFIIFVYFLSLLPATQVSLEGAMAMFEDERYRGDLATEVNKLRKLLTEEKKKSHGESARLAETSQLFEQVYTDYVAAMESVKTAQHEKKMKVQQQAVLTNIAESNIRDNVDSMTARLMQAEEALTRERREGQGVRERLAQATLDLEALPLLRAQVEVYQSDFNAERTARERIAGEKADLEEQLRKAGGGAATAPPQPQPTNSYRPQPQQERPQFNGRPQPAERPQYDNIPRTVNTRPDPPAEAGAKEEAFTCPKCNKEFRNMTLLTRSQAMPPCYYHFCLTSP